MPAGATYEPIATTTLSSAQSSVTFSSISGSYTDLVAVIAGTVTPVGATIQVQFNSDTAGNYSVTALRGDGSSATSFRGSNESNFAQGLLYSTQGNLITHIFNYSNTTTYKTAICRSNNPSNFVEARVGLWRSTSAITSIKFMNGDNFGSGTVFTLYGIKAA